MECSAHCKQCSTWPKINYQASTEKQRPVVTTISYLEVIIAQCCATLVGGKYTLKNY